MENYIPLKNFTYHLKNYFLRNPEKLPQNINKKDLQIKSFQQAWTDRRLDSKHEYIRYMDILFLKESEPSTVYLHSYIITYLSTGSILDAMPMDLKKLS